MMWFDPYKLLANANFQDVIDVGATDPGGVTTTTAEDFSAPGGSVPAGSVAADALSPQAAPGVPTGSPAPAPGSVDPSFAGGSGDVFASPMDPGSTGFIDPGTAGGAAATPTGSETQGVANLANQPISSATQPGSGTGKDQSQVTAQQPTTPTGNRLNTGAGGGAANAFNQLATALNGVARAAQAGNPQAQQLMNMLRQMQQMGMMNNMMGGGAGYNPYMSQFNPWAARQRMEQMRREFMERQRLRQQLYGAGAGRPGGTFGGRRGR